MASLLWTRRSFLLAGTACIGATGPAASYWFSRKRSRPYDVRLGVIGVGGRGLYLAGLADQYASVIAVCDVDRTRVDRARARLGRRTDICDDYRKLLERKDIDAVVIAVP